MILENKNDAELNESVMQPESNIEIDNTPHNKRYWPLILVILFLLIALLASFFVYREKLEDASASSKMYGPFYAKEWQEMDRIWKETLLLSSRDISLYVNALWQQGRVQESLQILEKNSVEFPSELTPYVTMLRVLGYERSGRYKEGYQLGESMWNTTPQHVRFYLAYALGRLSLRMDQDQKAADWFDKMQLATDNRKEKKIALKESLNLKNVKLDNAAILLFFDPNDKKAKSLIEDIPTGAETDLTRAAVGYRYFLKKNYRKAMPLLAGGFDDPLVGEDARYYYAYAALRLGLYTEALEAWAWVANHGIEYPQRSIQRLKTLSKRYGRGRILSILEGVARTRKEEAVALEALTALISMGEKERREEYESVVLRLFPQSAQSAKIHWERGYSSWKDGRFLEALENWNKGSSIDVEDPELGARLLYWQIRIHQSLANQKEVARLTEKLTRRYPFEYYAFLLNSRPRIQDDVAYEQRLTEANTLSALLEKWGFVSFALVELAKEDTADARYRASKLAHWSGNTPTALRQAIRYYKTRKADDPITTELAEILYPRVFSDSVHAASKKTGVHPSVIWGIMRQESLFNPVVSSSAGAFGLMQLMPATAKEEARKLNLGDVTYLSPDVNILLGANHIKGLMSRFGDTPRALAAYNAGGTPVLRWSAQGIKDIPTWIEDITYPETRGYVKAVMGNISAYRYLYDETKK